MFLAPVSSWPEVSTHSVLIHLLPIFPSFFAIFCFTVGIVFNLTLHFPPQSTLAFYLSVKLLSLFPLVFISQLHGRAKYFSISVFDIQFPWTVFQDFLFFFSTRNSCKTRHIFKVAILRYNLSETPIINLPQAHEPVFHTCPTNLISALSLHTCLSHSLSDTYEIQQWEQRLPDFYWTQHTTKRHTIGQRGIKFTNVSAKVGLQWWKHGYLTSGTTRRNISLFHDMLRWRTGTS